MLTHGHWPTLVASFLYFDVSFMVWTMLGALGAQIGATLRLNPAQKGLMVAVPILGGAVLRIILGVIADRCGAKRTGMAAQAAVIFALAVAWRCGLPSFATALALGLALGIAGASFAVALPQAGRWYPAGMQGLVLGLAGAGNIGVVLDALIAPAVAARQGWSAVFGWALIPTALVLGLYALMAKDAPASTARRRVADYAALLRSGDAHWFCFLYTVSFGGFVGLASSFVLYFTAEYGLTPVHAGQWAAVCTLVGAMLRPLGGALADRLGGTVALRGCFGLAAAAIAAAAMVQPLAACAGAFMIASGALGMANGAVFQLLPQRFRPELGLMTGLVGCGGGLGGFALASVLGVSKSLSGSYAWGLVGFAGLCGVALTAIAWNAARWRSAWSPLGGGARI